MNATPLHPRVTGTHTHISLRWGSFSIHQCVVPKQRIAANYNSTKQYEREEQDPRQLARN